MGRKRRGRRASDTAAPGARPASNRRGRRLAVLVTGAVIVIAGCAAYLNSLRAPFVFDDRWAILENPTIRSLWPVSKVLAGPPGSSPVMGRPLLNLSLAVNYALGGNDVLGYHLVNLAVHLLAALALAALVRRTLAETQPARGLAGSAAGLSCTIALIWTVHPLLSEAVISVSQRAESMVGLFYLLTLYCVLRGSSSGHAARWYGLAVCACGLGMASKEVMVSAPLVVLVYDAVFLAGSVRKAIRSRSGLYVGLALTWILFAYLLASHGFARGAAAGFGGRVSPWQYLLTQCWAILHYLRLAFVPHPLVIDYGSWIAHTAWEIVPGALVVLALLSGTVVELLKGRALGFLGVWFFAVLSPSSSFVPLAAQTVAEKRMYLPLAALITAVVVGAFLGWRRLTEARWGGDRQRPVLRWLVPALAVTAVVLVLAFMSHLRGRDYRDTRVLWQVTAAEVPLNPRAHSNLGMALLEAGQVPEAFEQFRAAVALWPDYAAANSNAALALERLGRPAEAVPYMRAAVRLEPESEKAEKGLVRLLVHLGRWSEALSVAKAYLDRFPDAAGPNRLYGSLLVRMGRATEALPYLQRGRQDPGSSGADAEPSR